MSTTRTAATEGEIVAPLKRMAEPTFANILCAVDGTRASEAAVRMAGCLAGQQGRVSLLAATGERGSGGHRTASVSPEHAKRILTGTGNLLKEAGVTSSAILDRRSDAVEAIIERSREFDLLVIGAPATSAFSRAIFSGVADAVLDASTTPLLLVRHSFRGTLNGRRILAASDGDTGSERIADVAVGLAQRFNSPMSLVYVIDHGLPSRARAVELQARQLEEMLSQSLELVVQVGKPSEVILEQARRQRTALIVMGTRRLHGLRALGSVSRRVAHDAPSSVLLLPPE